MVVESAIGLKLNGDFVHRHVFIGIEHPEDLTFGDHQFGNAGGRRDRLADEFGAMPGKLSLS